MRTAVINKITDYARKDEGVFLITGDAGFGVLDEYKKIFPNRFLNLGIAEQNMISFAAGMGLAGFNVFIYNIIPFLLYRCYEQVRNDICYQELPITLVGIGSGVTYAPQGVTHYAVEDIALARTLPNLTILSPADPIEAEKCAEYAVKSKKPVYIRLAKSGESVIHKENIGNIENSIVVREGKEVAVLFHGSISVEVIKAVGNTKSNPMVISLPMVYPLNFAYLSKRLKNIHTIITVEEHFVDGGLGSIVSDWLTKENQPYRLIRLGIKNEFIHAIKNNAGMRKYYGISSECIMSAIEEAYRSE